MENAHLTFNIKYLQIRFLNPKTPNPTYPCYKIKSGSGVEGNDLCLFSYGPKTMNIVCGLCFELNDEVRIFKSRDILITRL